jgi:hypothetical protein
MNKYSAYIDESGDPHFNPGCSSSFFICATTIKEEDINTTTEAIERIKKKYDLHELKSSRISSVRRRTDILTDIAELPIMIFTIIVKKEKLNGEWFRYRNTFYKYIQGKLVSELCRVFGNIDFSFDRYGSDTYQESFKKYIEVKQQTEMFSSQINISSAKINPLIQISDIVSGSIRQYYDSEYSFAELILNNIWKGKVLIPNEAMYSFSVEATSAEDKTIANSALDSADRYISIHSKDQSKLMHCQVVEFLKQISFEEPSKFCHRNEIITWLNFLGIEISAENLSRTIISELRDDGVLLVSSDDGIKIPTSLRDIDKHYKFILGQSMPQLKRLKKMDQVLMARLPEKHKEFIDSMDGDIKEVLAKLHS